MSATEGTLSQPTNQAPAPFENRSRAARLGLRVFRGMRRFIGVLIALIIMIVIFAITQNRFFTLENFVLILRSMTVLYMVSIGNTFVLLTAGFDLSVGSMLSFAGILLAFMIGADWNPWLAMVLTMMATTALGGLANGVLIGYAKLSFFVVTLATLSLFRSASA